jgi:3',5'-cyclic AMP phosphodiesterase CpdA
LNRRTFSRLLLGAAALGAPRPAAIAATSKASNQSARSRFFRVAIVADTHIIDPLYKGPEDTPEDTVSMTHTAERLIAARDSINRLAPAVDHVFNLGDVVHDCPSTEYEFYFKNRTRLDIASEIFAEFHAPVHLALGNHDYSLPRISRETTHRLFAAKLNTTPYSAVNHKGWKFLILNNFLGVSWDTSHAAYDQGVGTLGQEQLNWLEAELAERMPTIVLLHYPLWLIEPKEFADYGLRPLLRKYADSVKLVLAGHWHKWVDFAHTFGPQHYIVASTRYDSNSYMILEIDRETETWRFLNARCADWSTHFSQPFA